MITQKLLGSKAGWVKRTVPFSQLWKSTVAVIFLLIFTISVFPFAAYAADGNTVTMTANSEDGDYGIQVEIKSVKDEDNSGKIIFSASLLKATSDFTNFHMTISSSLSSSAFRFSSTAKKTGLFASNEWTSDNKAAMISAGNMEITDYEQFLTVGATNVTFAGTSAYAKVTSTNPGVLFTCTLPVNESYTGDWAEGLQGILNISIVLFDSSINGSSTQLALLTQEGLDFPKAGSETGGTSGGTTSSTLAVSDNFTEPASGYFTTAGISVTPSTEDLSFTVACDNACVVAKVNSDGTYTRMTGTAVTGGCSFTADSASDQFVVVLKGDANGDGNIDASDFGALVAAYLSTGTLDALNTVVGDVDGNGQIDASDFGVLVAAYLGTGTVSW